LAALRAVCADADLVHAHGLRAGMLATLALGVRRRRIPLVVTWHTRAHSDGLQARMTYLLERRVARAAKVVLAVSSDLVERARRRGARDARLAPTAFPGPRIDAQDADGGVPDTPVEGLREKLRAELGAVDRPVVLTAGRLEPHQGHDVLLTAARAWRHREPAPLVLVVGEGSRRAELQRRIDAE
ncbi:glycosyltransferase, partial [Streptomyces sparsus]